MVKKIQMGREEADFAELADVISSMRFPLVIIIHECALGSVMR